MSDTTEVDERTEAQEQAEARQKSRKRSFKSGLAFLGVCAVLLVAVLIYSNLSAPSRQKFSLPQPPQMNNVQGAAPVTPEYHAQVQTKDAENLTQAEANGTDAFPIPSYSGVPAATTATAAADGNAGPPALDVQPSASPAPEAPAAQPQDRQYTATGAVNGNQDNTQQANPYAAYMKGLFSGAGGPKGNAAPVFVAANDLSLAPANSQAGGAADGGSGSTLATSLVPAPGTLLPARMINGLNSDAPGSAFAEITAGPLTGARVIGTFSTARAGLILKFTQMAVPQPGGAQPQNVSIQAEAISESGNEVPADVNNHFLENAAVTFVAGFGQSMGQLLEQSGSQTVSNGAGQAITSYPTLSMGKEVAAASGGAIGAVGQQFQQAFGNRPATVTIPPGQTFTLAFTGNNGNSTGGTANASIRPNVGGLVPLGYGSQGTVNVPNLGYGGSVGFGGSLGQ